MRRKKLPPTRSPCAAVWLALGLWVVGCSPGPRLLAVVTQDPTSIHIFDGLLHSTAVHSLSWPAGGQVRLGDVQLAPGGGSMLLALRTPPSVARLRVDGSGLDRLSLAGNARPSSLRALPGVKRWMVLAESLRDTSAGGLVLFVSNDALAEAARLPVCRDTPTGPAIHRDAGRAWVRCLRPGELVEVDTELNRIVRRATLGSGAAAGSFAACGSGGIEISRTGGTLLVPCSRTGWLLYVDRLTLAVYDSVLVGEGADLIAVGPRRSQAVVTMPTRRKVALLDLRGRAVLTQLDVPGTPVAAVFGSDGKRAYVLTSGRDDTSNTLLAIDFRSGSIAETAQVAGTAVGLATWPGLRSPVMRWASAGGAVAADTGPAEEEESPGP